MLKEIIIIDNVWISLNCTISNYVCIEIGSIIATNYFVRKVIPRFYICGSVPEKAIKSKIKVDEIW